MGLKILVDGTIGIRRATYARWRCAMAPVTFLTSPHSWSRGS